MQPKKYKLLKPLNNVHWIISHILYFLWNDLLSFKENLWTSLEADILDISTVGVWRHTSTTASASGGQNKTNSLPTESEIYPSI